VIERKVNSLSYEGFSALQKWCEEKGIQIKVPTARVLAVVEVIATRNIIAHNRGLVDERYIRAVRTSSFKIGNSRILDADDLFRAHALLNEVVFETDKAARNKFGLQAVEIARPATDFVMLVGDRDGFFSRSP
jgi:hypothetical protein